MAHTVETQKRAYEKVKQRRIDWFHENGPCKECGSWENLELDHVNPEEKESHSIWSWREDRRLAELSKCQVLCYECHKIKTAKYISIILKGKSPKSAYPPISNEIKNDILNHLNNGFGIRETSRLLNISHVTVLKYKNLNKIAA